MADLTPSSVPAWLEELERFERNKDNLTPFGHQERLRKLSLYASKLLAIARAHYENEGGQ